MHLARSIREPAICQLSIFRSCPDINTFLLALSTASPPSTVTMDDTVYLYYRLYDGQSVLASKFPVSTQHTNVSSIDVQDIFPPFTVANITAMILAREGETGSTAAMYLDRRDAMPAAATTTIDIDNGPSTKMSSAIRVVVRPGATAATQAHRSSLVSFPTLARVPWRQTHPTDGLESPPNSTAAVRGYLQKDYEIHDAFFSVGGGHNHTPFHMLTEYALGAAPAHIEAIWKVHLTLEKPAFPSPGQITAATFADHLGERPYYQAYLKFFSEEVLSKGSANTIEEWLFTSKANFDGKAPQMLNRLLAGILHPMLYVGYGVEFAIPGLVAEGLAQAAVHQLGKSLVILPQKMFPTPPSRPDHAFSIASRILLDDRFDDIKPTSLDDVLEKFGDVIYGYAAQWTVDGANAQEVENKVQELCFLNVMLYAVGGWHEGSFREAEFTIMHLVTTSLRLSSLMAIITIPTSKSIFLRAYFARSLGYWISRGRRPLDVRSFFASRTSLSPTVPAPVPTPYASAFPMASSPLAICPNSWLQLVQSALVHPDDHLCKVIRALAHYGSIYGSIPAGTFRTTELKDSEMGRVREGEKDRYWTNDGNHADDPDHLL
ncbi:hypothetical protein MVEN_01621600 [Mycena venus]|uniref:Uncharacterized protein n=1 Tax=Mycena venus TaxID=2733690 RepID=A0A8H6XQ85_9AGAR|nr:hypothetical protein MVEN_01621600 [Mycena venus]